MKQRRIGSCMAALLAALAFVTVPAQARFRQPNAEYEVHELGGCAREAYAPIVGAGLNSTVLHYSALDNEIKTEMWW